MASNLSRLCSPQEALFPPTGVSILPQEAPSLPPGGSILPRRLHPRPRRLHRPQKAGLKLETDTFFSRKEREMLREEPQKCSDDTGRDLISDTQPFQSAPPFTWKPT